MTGSSAEQRRLPIRSGVASMLCPALSALICSASSANARLRFVVLLRSRAGKAGLELVAQGGQLGQVGVVGEGLAETRLVVAKLGLRDGKVLPDAGAFGAVGVWPGVPAAFRTARGPWCSRESMDWRVVAPSR